jgi:hypothetical protein
MRVLIVLFIATLAVLALLFVIGPDREKKYTDNGRGVYLPHAQEWDLPRDRPFEEPEPKFAPHPHG